MPTRHPIRLLGALVSSLPFWTPGAFAADPLRDLPLGNFVDVTSLEMLADLVVTDTKIAQSPDTVTQKIVVLQADDIAGQPDNTRNLAELMRYTSGQFVNVLSRNDANWGAYAGLGPKYNSYLLDGLPIDSFVDAMSLDPQAIERIEIHKGPASVLYSNYLTMDFAGNLTPLAGTTNFVLRQRVDEPLTRVALGTGSWHTYAGRLLHQGRQGNFSYRLSGALESSDYTQYGAQGSWLQSVEEPDYRKTRLFAQLNYAFDRPDHGVTLFAHHTAHEGDMGRPNRDFEHRYDTLNLTYNNPLAADWHLQIKLGERRYDRAFGNDAYPASLDPTGGDRIRQTIRPMDLTVSHRQGEFGLLTFGVDHQRVHYRTTQEAPGSDTARVNDAEAASTGLFVQEKLHFGNWVVRAGLRHDQLRHDYALLGGHIPETDTAEWHKNLWSLGLRYNARPGLALYANAGTSFMAPTAKQIGGTLSDQNVGQFANPGLAPENGLGLDLGLDWQLGEHTRIGLRAFWNSLDDAIVDSAISDTQSISQNSGQAVARGLEIDLALRVSERIEGFANATFTHARLENPGLARTEIPMVPDQVANLGVRVGLTEKTTLNAYLHWVGRYYDSADPGGRQAFGDHGVVNARLRHAWRPDTEFTLDLNNLGDQRYDMPWGFRDPGFNAWLGVSHAF